MSGSRKLRSFGMVLTLAALVGLAGAQPGAAALRNRAPARQAGFFELAWDWLTGWIGGQGYGARQNLSRLWAGAGMGSDPNGGGATVQGDMGPGLDPNGGRTTVQGDAGYGSDPNGKPATVQGDAGFGLDPNGSH